MDSATNLTTLEDTVTQTSNSAETDRESGLDPLRTKGLRSNRKLEFNLSLSGDEIYRTLKLMEELAVESHAYLQVRECVLLSERIREQANKQGF